jgi:hypothetical protein
MAKMEDWRGGLPLSRHSLETGEDALRARGMSSPEGRVAVGVMETPAVSKLVYFKTTSWSKPRFIELP